jgi:hypothetical protein
VRNPKAPWWEPYQDAHDRTEHHNDELDAAHELAFALEASTWFRGGAHAR